MFKNRKNSQKPNEAFYTHFRQSFSAARPDIDPSSSAIASTSASTDTSASAVIDDESSTTPVVSESTMGQSLIHRPMPLDRSENLQMVDSPTSSSQDQWGVTPSVMDPGSYAFSTLANQPPSYYTAVTSPGGVSSIQLGNMTSPSMPLNFLAPMLAHAGALNQAAMNPPTITNPAAISNPPTISNPSCISNPPTISNPARISNSPTISNPAMNLGVVHQPFMPNIGHNMGVPGHPFAQTTMLQGRPDIDMNSSNNAVFDLRRPSMPMMADVHDLQAMNEFQFGSGSGSGSGNGGSRGSNFRYQVILRAATAMIKDRDEIPVTYLNKGQAYTVTIVDTAAMLQQTPRPTKYRTFIRISFDENEQRLKQASCWQLWQEGRGANEAHHRDGKLLAVEHVDPNQGGDGESRHQQVRLENANFDGFSVIWTPTKQGRHECAISVRFNFLSTDFSHSKGVKGIPVRLCAKTDVYHDPHDSHTGKLPIAPEVCYCKVKLFRDHGAERKLSNDVAHVKKLIEKVKAQISQADLSSGNGDKRKRSGSISMKGSGPKMIKAATKTKRSWSIGQNDATKPAELGDDLQIKLQNLSDMFSSTRAVSILNLKGAPQDDPDLYPVRLDTSQEHGLPKHLDWDSQPQGESSMSHSFSPTSSHHSIASSHHSGELNPALLPNNQIYDESRHGSVDWSQFPQQDDGPSSSSHMISQPVKIQRTPGIGDVNDSWFEAMGVDPNYMPPTDMRRTPKHCFYVKGQHLHEEHPSGLYHAIYLEQRSVRNFVDAIANKWKFDPASVVRVVSVRDGLNIVVDDDVINELPEGKDMIAEWSGSRRESTESNHMDLDSPLTGTPAIEIQLRL
ncbi:hypothetical protein FQN57_006729 [Myotisia sp. PD_48]|nr:hypothetical protein FQN57_006729 [Myotisia sp. PD_48]